MVFKRKEFDSDSIGAMKWLTMHKTVGTLRYSAATDGLKWPGIVIVPALIYLDMLKFPILSLWQQDH